MTENKSAWMQFHSFVAYETAENVTGSVQIAFTDILPMCTIPFENELNN